MDEVKKETAVEKIEGSITCIDPPEKTRTYWFPKGEKISIENVAELIVRPSGTHRLKTTSGKAYIVPAGWLCIELDIDQWTV